MKLQIDTDNKTIQIIDSELNLGELIKELKKLFPNGEWKKYTIEDKTPYFFPYIPYVPYYPSPITEPYYFYYDGSGTNGVLTVTDHTKNDTTTNLLNDLVTNTSSLDEDDEDYVFDVFSNNTWFFNV